MSELVAALVASIVCSAIYWQVVAELRRQLREGHQQSSALISDLLSRLAARDPESYQAWRFQPQAPPLMEEPPLRVYDETGLLSVPVEDRLED